MKKLIFVSMIVFVVLSLLGSNLVWADGGGKKKDKGNKTEQHEEGPCGKDHGWNGKGKGHPKNHDEGPKPTETPGPTDEPGPDECLPCRRPPCVCPQPVGDPVKIVFTVYVFNEATGEYEPVGTGESDEALLDTHVEQLGDGSLIIFLDEVDWK